MDFTQQSQEQPAHLSHTHGMKYVLTAVIVGSFALFMGVVYFMYTTSQRNADAARYQRNNYNQAPSNTYVTPSPMVQQYTDNTPASSTEEQAVQNISIQDPSTDFAAIDQQSSGL